MAIVRFFIDNHRITLMVLAVLLLSGIFSLLTLPREEMPAYSMNLVKISTIYPGALPEDVEITVTNPLERELESVENIRKTTSVSLEGLSIIMVEITENAPDPDKVQRHIRNAVLRVTDLPDGVSNKPEIEEITSSYPLYEIALSGGKNEFELRQYARDLEDALRDIPGTGTIKKIGYRQQEVHIHGSITKMKREVISFNNIIDAVQNRNVKLSGGSVKTASFEQKILTNAEYRSPMNVKNAIIRSNYEGYKVRLTDVASVSRDFEKPRVLYRGNGRPGISILLSRQPGADIIDLSNNIQQTIKEFRKGLPEDIIISEIYDFSLLTRTMLDIMAGNALMGIVLVLGVMFLFMDWRSAAWSAFGIPFSVLVSMIFFHIMGISINTISLGGLILVIGIIVDDAIVITEKIFSLKSQGIDSRSASLMGIKAMIVPVSASSLTTICAFLPILFIPGIMGRFMEQIPLVITIALAVSLTEAVIFVPAHMSITKDPSVITDSKSRFDSIKKSFALVIEKCIQNHKKVLFGFLFVMVMIFALAAHFLNFKLDEDINPDYFSIIVEAPPGTSLEQTNAVIPQIERTVYTAVPEYALKSVTTHIGHHNTSLNYLAMGSAYSNHAIISVYLNPASQRGITTEEIIAGLKPGLKALKSALKLDRLDASYMGFETGKALEVTFISNNDKLRNKFEQELLDFLKSMPVVTSLESTNIIGSNQLNIVLDYDMLAETGLTVMDVARTVRCAFEGVIATSLTMGDEIIQYRVGIDPRHKYTQKELMDIPVANHENRLIAMKHIARLTETPEVTALNHYNGKRSVTITGDIDESQTTSAKINTLIKKQFYDKVLKTPGLQMKLGGQEEETALSMKGFYFALVIALFSIYFILVIVFNSYVQPLLIMSIIPFAVAGVFLTLLLHGHTLVFISLAALLGLIGVVVNDTIVMISHLNSIRKEEGSEPAAIAKGVADRLRPVLLTTLTTFAGLLPTAYGFGGEVPLLRPMILSMAWGLVFTTLVTLVFIPVVFSFTKRPGNEKNTFTLQA